ncbi:MAG: sensor histidine kinase [Phycisphaerae bacterium]|jgi:two-component system phosphate regulon sensor histidine kinase PhoR
MLAPAILAEFRVPGTHSTQAAVLAVLVAILAASTVALLLVLIQRYRMVKDIIRWLRVRRMGEPQRPPIVLAHAHLERLVREIQSLANASETERRELLVQSSYLQTLLACLNDPVIILDPAGVPVLSNRRAVELLITPADPDSQASLRDFAAQAPVQDITRIALRSGTPVSRQIRLAIFSRPRVLQITAAPISPGLQPRGVLLLLQDQTELLQNVQIKADFAANASHELRTPLASIRAAVETINEAGYEDHVTLKRCLDIVGGHVLRLQLLVQDLLDLSRTEDPRAVVRYEPIKLDEVRELISGMFKSMATEKHLELRFEIAPDARIMQGDERLVMLILKNLIDNSLKFTSAGFIQVRWLRQTRPMRNAAIKSDAFDPNATEDMMILEVEDTGCGIPPEDIHRVFERFYTVNRSRGGADRGTGLGLAIVKHAVAAMGGVVELHSQTGKGTIMRCIWPQSRQPMPPRRPAVEPSHASPAD